MRETVGADTLTPEAWDAEAAKCRADGDPVPDRRSWIRNCVAEGWTPIDPRHLELIEYESMRSHLGDAAMDADSGPLVEWPAEWGAWSLVGHRRTIAHHFHELERIRDEENRHAGGR